MNIPFPEPTLSQISALLQLLRRDEALRKHFDLDDEKTYDIISRLSYEQYRLVYAYLFNKKRTELNNLLHSLGIKSYGQ